MHFPVFGALLLTLVILELHSRKYFHSNNNENYLNSKTSFSNRPKIVRADTSFADTTNAFDYSSFLDGGVIKKTTLSSDSYLLQKFKFLEETFKTFIRNGSFSIPTPDNDYNILKEESAFNFDDKSREDELKITKASQNPYSVLLGSFVRITLHPELRAICSGSLVTDEWVLTAAHCMIDTESNKVFDAIGVFAGEKIRKKYEQIAVSDRFFTHPRFDPSNANNYDLGLVKTARPLNLTSTVNIIRLSMRPWLYRSYKSCSLTGFGRVRMEEKSKEDCKRKTQILEVKNPCKCFPLPAITSHGNSGVMKLICSKPQVDVGICPGDSGAGLICDGDLYAVASFILDADLSTCETRRSHECGGRDTLSVFQEVCPSLLWVNKHVNLYHTRELSQECVNWTASAENVQFILPLIITTLLVPVLLNH